MKNTKLIVLAISIFCFALVSKAQVKNITAEQKNSLLTTWHESPNESKDGNLVFKTTVFVVPINELVVPQLARINFSKDKTVTTVFLRSCNFTEQETAGKWSIVGSTLTIESGTQKCKYIIMGIEKDKLTLKLAQ